MPSTFLISGGISDATDILKDYHRRAYLETNKAKEVEAEIVIQLSGLRNDLSQKIKEIKGLSGDFKNTVDKEVDATRKAVRNLHEALGLVDTDAAATSGKGDPFIIKMGVDRQIEKQLEEENYLHRVSNPSPEYYNSMLIRSQGISKSGKLRARARVYCRWRNPESVQCVCEYSETRCRYCIRYCRSSPGRSHFHAQRPGVERFCSTERSSG